MKKLALLALIGFIPVQCAPTYAQTVGDMTQVHAVCASREVTDRHVLMAAQDGNYDRINAEFLTAVADGSCFKLAAPVATKIEEIGVRGDTFVDKEGDIVRLTSIKVMGAWSLYLEILGKGGKS